MLQNVYYLVAINDDGENYLDSHGNVDLVPHMFHDYSVAVIMAKSRARIKINYEAVQIKMVRNCDTTVVGVFKGD